MTLRFEIDQELKHLDEPQEDGLVTLEQPSVVTDLRKRAEKLTELILTHNEDPLISSIPRIERRKQERRELVQQWGENGAPDVLDGVLSNAECAILAERHQFAMAAGMYALVKAGFDKAETQKMSSEMYGEFLERYGIGRADDDTRNEAMNKIQESAEIITGQKVR